MKLCDVLCNYFFADYPLVSCPEDADSAERAAPRVFDLLGWALKQDGNKAECFSGILKSLEVVLVFPSTGGVRWL